MILRTKHIIFCIIASALFLTSGNFSAIYLFSHPAKNFPNTKSVQVKQKLIEIEADTSLTSNQITRIWYSSYELNVQIYQVEKQQEISITVYNMLGKEVLDVFKGTTSSRQEETYSVTFNLPNGIYICIMQGKGFRDSEKFIISR